jgi:hypothetical protein
MRGGCGHGHLGVWVRAVRNADGEDDVSRRFDDGYVGVGDTRVNDRRRSETRASRWMKFSPACPMRRSRVLRQLPYLAGAEHFREPSRALRS